MTTPFRNIEPKPNAKAQRLVLVPAQVNPNTTFVPSTHLPRLIVRSESSPVVGFANGSAPSTSNQYQKDPNNPFQGLWQKRSVASQPPFPSQNAQLQWPALSIQCQNSVFPPKPPPLPSSPLTSRQPMVHRVQLAPTSNKLRGYEQAVLASPSSSSSGCSSSSSSSSSAPFLQLGSPRVAASIRHRRDVLRNKIEQRPTRQNLVTQHILLTASRADPLIQQRAASLRKCGIVSNLNRKLRQRPGPLELVTRKILRADAELEQAIQEGRLLFKATTADENEISAYPIESEFNPINPDMEVVAVSAPKEEIPPTTNLQKISVLKNKKKSTPYQSPVENGVKPQKRASNVKEHETMLPNDHESTSNNYQILLKQQQIFLDWQPGPEEAKLKSGSEDEKPILTQTSEETLASEGSMQMIIGTPTLMHQTNLIQEPMSLGIDPTGGQAAPISNPGLLCYPPRSLNDLKVQDLKNECKKRNLPVSGAKPQLVERLRPHEQMILAGVSCQIEGGPSTPPVSPDEQLANTSPRTPKPSHAQGVVREQTRETIHDFLQQNAAKLKLANAGGNGQQLVARNQSQFTMNCPPKTLSLTMAPQQQFVKLVDQNGTVVGMASVMSNGTLIQANPTNMITTMKPNEAMNGGSPMFLTTTPTTADDSSISQAVNGLNEQRQAKGQMVMSSLLSVNAKPNGFTSSKEQPTFRFAQMGSGGQFTIVQPSNQSSAETPTITMNTSPTDTFHVFPVSAVSAQMQPISSHQLLNSNGIGPTMMINQNGTPMQVLHIAAPNEVINLEDQAQHKTSVQQTTQGAQVVQVAYVDGDGVVHRIDPSGSPIVGDAAASSPNMPPPAIGRDSSLTPVPTNMHHSGPTPTTITIDTNDSSSLATTLQMHEEMLKFQQKKIEEMRTELIRSQQQLRAQQSLIMVAKKQQFGEGGRTAMTDHYLAQLKNAYRSHINQVMLHKDQEVQLQQQVHEQNSLVAGEAKLQEELHVEQAVNDIVRLIKQDARTALLIVQLLRKYQLERQAELAQQQQKLSQEQQKMSEETQPSATEPQTKPVTSTATKRTKSKSKQQGTTLVADRAHSETPQQQKHGNLLVPGAPMTLTQQRRASNPETMRNKEEAFEVHTISDDEPTHPPVSTSASKPKSKSKRSGNHPNDGSKLRTHVDMEEIFKTVLKDANRAIGQEITEEVLNDGVTTIAYGSPISVSQENVALDVACNLSVPHMDAETVVGEVNHGVDAQNFIMVQQSCSSDVAMDECSRGAVTSNAADSSCHSTALSFSQAMEHNAQTPPCFSKNEDFDDLMDVLRDDQVHSMGPGQIMDFGLGYGQEELAKLIGDDWIESADRSLHQENSQHHHDQVQSCAAECLGDPLLIGENGDDTNMDWLDMMLQNAPLEEGFDGLRTPSYYQRNQMNAPC